MYTPAEFDYAKTQIMKYILYKKRTEGEVRKKFCHTIEENMLEDIIEYVKEAGYINDKEYIGKLMKEYQNLKLMSIREIKHKVYQKGIYADDIEDYLNEHREEMEEYELNSAKRLIEKKKGMEPQKLKAYLIGKGFDMEILNQLINVEEEL